MDGEPRARTAARQTPRQTTRHATSTELEVRLHFH